MQPPRRYLNAWWNAPFGTSVTAVRRDESGKLIREQFPAEFASFIPAEKATEKVLSRLRSSRYVKRIHPEGKYVRVCWTDSRIARKAADPEAWFAAQRIPVLEADVDPVRRWVAEHRIQIARPRRVYLDLETDSRVRFSQKKEARILCWSLVGGDGNLKVAEALPEDDDDAEEALLRRMWSAMNDFDQVVAWGGDRFDFEMLEHRSKYLGINVELRRWLWLDHLPVFRRLNAHAAKSGAEKQRMSLGAVARAVLGEHEKKLVNLGAEGVSSWGLWEAGGEDRERLRLYCLDDSDKMRKIEEKTGYLDLLQTLCEATCCFPDTRGLNPTRQIEGFMLRLGRERDVRFPTRQFPDEDEEQEQYGGAYRVEPRDRGILRNVHVADFERMYPSILISWNMSPETWAPYERVVENTLTRPSYLSHLPLERWPIPEGHCVAAGTELVFRTEPEGILAAAVGEILKLREVWESKKKAAVPGSPEWSEANRRVQAYKIAANSFYGVIGCRGSRFFQREVAESCTLTGVWLIQQVEDEGKKRGIRTSYIDTDSLFVMGCSEQAFGEFVEHCNDELFPSLLAERKAPMNRVRLGYEKTFDRLVMISKCNYFGSILHFKGKRADANTEPEIKGIAYKRGDSLRLTRDFQVEVIDRILGYKCEPSERLADFIEIVERWKARILLGELELEDVVNSKRLSKAIREYVAKPKADGTLAALPSHVEVAKILRSRGRDVAPSTVIEYFVVDGSDSPLKCVPAEDWDLVDRGPADMKPSVEGVEPERPSLDRYYLWEAQVYPPTQRVLEAAFPTGPWRSFEKVRPPHLRGRAAREPTLPGLDTIPTQRARPAASQGARREVSDRSDTSPKKAAWAGSSSVMQQRKLFE